MTELARKVAQRMVRTMLSGFDHVTVAVAELEPAIERYTALFGHAPRWRGTHPELGTEAALFGLSNSLIELVAPAAGAPEAEGLREHLARAGEGLSALAFATPDAAACSRCWREQGLRAAPPEAGSARGQDGSQRSYQVVELSARSTRGLRVFAVERGDAPELQRNEPGSSSAVYALDHVVVRSAEPDAALALYGSGLGIRLALDREFRGTRMLFFRIGGVTLEVVRDPAQAERDALWGLAYRVRDIDQAHARLAAAGFAPSAPRAGNKPNTRVFSLRAAPAAVPTLILYDPARE